MTWIVHVGGLVRTGSGAVKDALLDTGRFTTLKGKSATLSESRVFVGTRAIPDLVASTPGLTQADVLALWTAGTRNDPDDPLAVRTRRFLRATRETHAVNHKVFKQVADDPLLAAASITADSIARATTPEERSTAYITSTYAAMRELLPAEDQLILIDNDPAFTEHVERHLRLDPHTVFVGVIRNPSDQFIDRRTAIVPHQSRLTNLAYMTWSGLLRRRRLRSLTRAAEAFPDRCLIVEFERFVTERSYRDRLIDSVIAKAPRHLPGPRARFDADQSARNVGLPPLPADRLQHAVYTRLLDGPYRGSRERSGPSNWPEVATGRPSA